MQLQTSGIQIVTPDDPEFERVDISNDDVSKRHLSTLFYNEVIEAYNEMPVGAVLVVPLLPHIRFYNLKTIFAGRGLQLGVDLLLTRQPANASDPAPKSQRPIRVKRLTDKPGKMFDINGSEVQTEDADDEADA